MYNCFAGKRGKGPPGHRLLYMTNEDQTRNADDDDSKQRRKNSSLLSNKFYIYRCLPHCYNVTSQKMIFKKCDNATHSALSLS